MDDHERKVLERLFRLASEAWSGATAKFPKGFMSGSRVAIDARISEQQYLQAAESLRKRGLVRANAGADVEITILKALVGLTEEGIQKCQRMYMKKPENVTSSEWTLLNHMLDKKLKSLNPQTEPAGVTAGVCAAIFADWERKGLVKTHYCSATGSKVMDMVRVNEGQLEFYQEKLASGAGGSIGMIFNGPVAMATNGNANAAGGNIVNAEIGGDVNGQAVLGISSSIKADSGSSEVIKALLALAATVRKEATHEAQVAADALVKATEEKTVSGVSNAIEEALAAKPTLAEPLRNSLQSISESAIGSFLFETIRCVVKAYTLGGN